MKFPANRARRAALLGFAALLALGLTAQAADYPEPAGDAGGGVPARRPERRARPHRRQEDGATARPAVRDREQAGRRRQYRRRFCRACDPRRLHAADGQQQHPRHQREPVQETHLQSGKGFRPDHADRHAGQYPGGQSRRAGEFAERTDRSLQGAARQDQFRLVRLRRGGASGRRTVQGGGACRYRARALQGRGAGACRT